MSDPGSSQRRYERFDLFERAALIDSKGKRTSVVLIDVSLGGAQVLARNSFPEGEACQLEVDLGGEPIMIAGTIRYNKPGQYELTAVGFKMSASTGDERIAIATLVNKIFMNPSEVPHMPAKIVESWLEAA